MIRNRFFDLARGSALFFAASIHYVYYLQSWYLGTFHSNEMYNPWRTPIAIELYQEHLSLIGRQLMVPSLVQLLVSVLGAWMAHFFVSMMGYNLGRISPVDARIQLKKRLSIYSFVLVLAFFENAIISSHIGQLFSISALTMWMLLMITLDSVYSYFGIQGVLLLFTVSMLRDLPVIRNLFDFVDLKRSVQLIHPWAEVNTPFLSYLPALSFGLLLRQHSQKVMKHFTAIFLVTLTASVALFFYEKQSFLKDTLDTTITGNLLIIGILTLLLTSLEKLKYKKIPAILMPIEWLGKNSLGFFLFYMIFFTKVLAPLRFHMGSYFHIPMTNTSGEVILYFSVTVYTYWLLKSRFFGKKPSR